MANNNLSSSENILVKVDQNNIVFIDPNSVVEEGKVKTRNIKQENLVIYVNLEADLIERTTLAVNNTKNTNTSSSLLSVARGTLNMMKNNKGKDFDTTWTDSFYDFQPDQKDATNKGGFYQSDSTAQTFGIESININIAGANYIPQVNITFIDVRGKTLFESPSNSPYSAFFHLPWPIFYLTVKGFYGKAIRYRLHLADFSSSFNGNTGNFDISTTFVGSTYAYLNDIPLNGAFTAPYLYAIEKNRTSTTNGKNNTTTINVSRNSKGYQMLHSVYQEYIAKGYLPANFKTITLSELVNKAKSLDVVIEQAIFNGVDAKVFSGIKEYEDILNQFESAINNWKSINTDSKPITLTNLVYFPLKGSLNGNTDSVYSTNDGNSLFSILKNYTNKLSKSAIFVEKYVKDKSNPNFKGLTFVYKNEIKDLKKYIIPDGANLLLNLQGDETNTASLLNDLYLMFASFIEQRNKFQDKVQELINKVINDSSIGGLGFEPTIRNVFAVLLANADVYVRMMKDVHLRAFDAGSKRKKKVAAFCKETLGNNEVYPWPEITKASTGNKNKVLMYPGDEKLYSQLGSNNPTLWPEVDFVENYVAVSTKRVDNKADKEGGVNKINFVFEQNEKTAKTKRISTLFQLWDDSPYLNKTISSVLYEIWERARYSSFYNVFDNKVIEEISNIEFENLKTNISEDFDVVNLLKSVLTVNADDNQKGIYDSYHKFVAYLHSFSPFEREPYLNDFLPTVPYIKDILTKSFNLEQYADVSKYVNNDSSYPNLNSSLKRYQPEKYRASIYPFNSPTYLSYLSLNKFDADKQLSMVNVLELNTEEGLVSTSNDLDWTKSGFTNNLFVNKLKFNDTSYVHILNTPYFHQTLIGDFAKPTSYGKYVGSAYLLLNSLPFKELSDTFINPETKTEVLLTTMFKETGASHTIPYHLICKWGSIYHRYKNYILDGTDILSGFSYNNITNALNNDITFDDNSGLTYELYGNNITSNTNDIGIHPFYDDVFHNIVNNYSFFNPLNGSVEYNQNIDNEVIKNRVRTRNNVRYYTNFIENFNIVSGDTYYTLLPSDGANNPLSNLNINNDVILDSQNGYRILWYTGETSNVDYEGQTLPTPYEYLTSYKTGATITNQNNYALSTNYVKVVDLIATFSPEILDKFEETFLEFASEIENVEIPYIRYPKVKYNKFQTLLKDIVTVKKTDITTTSTEAVIGELVSKQKVNLEKISTDILQKNNLIKLTISNPRDFDINTVGGFIGFENINTKYDPYQEYKYEDNKKYIDLYIGEELDVTKKYKRFFMDNNIDLNESNVRTLRALIYMYAGGMGVNFTHREDFNDYISTNIIIPFTTRDRYFMDLIINNFKNLEVDKNGQNQLTLYKGYNMEYNKLEMYSQFKSFNDKWVAGNSIGQKLLIEEFLFLDRANRDIGDKAYVDIKKLISLDDNTDTQNSIYGAIGTIIEGSNFIFRGLPSYTNFYGSNLTTKSKLEGSKKTAKNIFGTFLEVDYQESTPKMIIQYIGPTSKYLDMEYIQDKMKFKNDSGNMFDMNASPLIITNNDILKTGDLNKSNKVVAFEVSVGDQANGIFKGVKLDQATLRNTYASQIVNENMGRSETGSGTYQVDIGLFDIYRQVSYTCEITMMGCAMIQPSMYFYLKNIPMFKGSYWITEVKHSIRNNTMETSFTGYRMPYAALPDPKDSIMLAYRALFESVTNKAIALVKSENTNIDSKTNKANQNVKSIKLSNGKSAEIDPGPQNKNVKGEKFTNDSNITSYGVPYNGYNKEKYIQKVVYNGKTYLRAQAVLMGGNTYSIASDKEMSLVKQTVGKITWAEMQRMGTYYFATKFDLGTVKADVVSNYQPTFYNPSSDITIPVSKIYDLQNGVVSGAVDVGPAIDGFGVALSAKLMSDLKLYEGDVVYFTLDNQ